MRFDDQVAVVTGAGDGLGKQYASLLAARGARVVVNDIGGSVTGMARAPKRRRLPHSRFAIRAVRPSRTATA